MLGQNNILLAVEGASQFELPGAQETLVDVAGFYTVSEWYAQQCSHHLLHLLTVILYPARVQYQSGHNWHRRRDSRTNWLVWDSKTRRGV